MANNPSSLTDLSALLSGHFMNVIETASNFLATDSDGNHLFLILAKTKGTLIDDGDGGEPQTVAKDSPYNPGPLKPGASPAVAAAAAPAAGASAAGAPAGTPAGAAPAGNAPLSEADAGQQLINWLRNMKIMLDGCIVDLSKQRCGGGWSPGGGNGGPRTTKSVKLAEAYVPQEVANSGIATADGSDTVKELRIITGLAQLLRAGLLKEAQELL